MKKVLFLSVIILAFYSVVCSGVVFYNDPLAVGIGSRPIGMGRAFVAVADDSNAILMNPAGLGSQKAWSISSMSTTFMEDYPYTMLSGVYPTSNGVYGLSYVAVRCGDILATDGGSIDYYNQALVLAYGRYVGDSLSKILGQEHEIYAGANLKYYSKGFSGDESINGTGANIDLGLKYVQNKYWSYGIDLQNMLYGSRIGGDFEPEDMPFAIRLGAVYNWVEYNVKIALDKELNLGRSEMPWPMHFGVEWRAHEYLFLRAGYDQVAGGTDGGDLATNPTFGVGFAYNGLRLDLSYMQNFADTNISSTFISFSFYGGPLVLEKKPAEEVKPAPPKPEEAKPIKPEEAKPILGWIHMTSPADDLMTEKSAANFAGSVEAYIVSVRIDAQEAALNKDRKFSVQVPLESGMNTKTVMIYDLYNNSATIAKKIVRYYLPTDIPVEVGVNQDFEHKIIYTMVRQYIGRDYAMKNNLSRETLAMIFAQVKRLGMQPPVSPISIDVSSSYWAAGYINSVINAGYMKIYSDGTFRPGKLVTREELAYLLTRVTQIQEITIAGFMQGKKMSDNATMADLIDLLYNTGLLDGDVDGYKDFLGIRKGTI